MFTYPNTLHGLFSRFPCVLLEFGVPVLDVGVAYTSDFKYDTPHDLHKQQAKLHMFTYPNTLNGLFSRFPCVLLEFGVPVLDVGVAYTSDFKYDTQHDLHKREANLHMFTYPNTFNGLFSRFPCVLLELGVPVLQNSAFFPWPNSLIILFPRYFLVFSHHFLYKVFLTAKS